MEVTVGSENPAKATAVSRALERYGPTVTAVGVDSGVAEQPRSVAETVTGAENRARRAHAATGADYGVGLEGGVARIDGAPEPSLIMWAAVTDGESIGRGGGPTVPLPDPVVARLEDGAELGPVMDGLVDADGLARHEGAIGVLTDDLIDRTRALESAVAVAFGPFLTPHYATGTTPDRSTDGTTPDR